MMAAFADFDVVHKIADFSPVKVLSRFAAVDKLAKSASEASANIRAREVIVDLDGVKTFDSTFKRNLRLIDVGGRKVVVVERMKKAIEWRDNLIRALHSETDPRQQDRWSQLHKHYHFKVVLLLKKLDLFNKELIEVAEGAIAFEDIKAGSRPLWWAHMCAHSTASAHPPTAACYAHVTL